MVTFHYFCFFPALPPFFPWFACVLVINYFLRADIAWEKGERHKAIKRMKVQKSANECGLVANVLKHAPGSFIDTLVGAEQFKGRGVNNGRAANASMVRACESAGDAVKSHNYFDHHLQAASTPFFCHRPTMSELG